MIQLTPRYEAIFNPDNMLKSMSKHFDEDEHYFYIDDKYSLGALPHTPWCFSMVIDYKGFLNAPADKNPWRTRRAKA